jgi:hypothetical protein
MLLWLLFLWACQTPLSFTVEPIPSYDAAFEGASGWTGGDGAYSVDLGASRVLWLFGDTLIGRVQGERRIGTRLIHNSAAIQTGREPAEAPLAFFHRTSSEGRPAAFITPADGLGWMWPYHGVRTTERLYVFLLQIEPADGPAGFGFKPTSTWLGQYAAPDENPEDWDLVQLKVPWGNEKRLFGSAVMLRGDTCYIYGTVDDTSMKHMLVARVPVRQLTDFSAWRFFADGEWVDDVERADRVCENVASEFSVSYLPKLDRYAMVYTEGGLSPNIVLRFSARPEGPWGDPVLVYRCPEAAWDSRIFCYAAKGHPELAGRPDELIVTYVANARDFAMLESDARLYRPRFLRISFDGKQTGAGSAFVKTAVDRPGFGVHGSSVQRFTVGEK